MSNEGWMASARHLVELRKSTADRQSGYVGKVEMRCLGLQMTEPCISTRTDMTSLQGAVNSHRRLKQTRILAIPAGIPPSKYRKV